MGDKPVPVVCDGCQFLYHTNVPKEACEHCGDSNLRVLTELEAHELMHKIFRKMREKKPITKWEI